MSRESCAALIQLLNRMIASGMPVPISEWEAAKPAVQALQAVAGGAAPPPSAAAESPTPAQ